MPGHKSNNALPSAREKLLDEVSNDAVPAWPLDADSPIRLGQTPEQEKHVQIRLILIILVWMSVTGMWISFPVVDLKESKSPLGPALLRYQNIANLNHPLTLFLLSSMAFSLTTVALASTVAEVEGPLRWSLATTLTVNFLAVFAGLHYGVTLLQNFLLVLPLSTALVLTIIVFKVTPRKSHKESLQHDQDHSHTSEGKFFY